MKALATLFLAAFCFYGCMGLSACKLDGTSEGCACSISLGRTVVDCSGLSLQAIPTNIPINTSTLILSRNSIASIPAQAFNTLNLLSDLRISNNLLTTVSSGAFAGLVSLNSLYLSGNPLLSLASDVFSPTTSLRTLYLSQGRFSSVPAAALNIPLLTVLDLSSNSITTVSDLAFTGLPLLKQLFLSDNMITSVSANSFQSLPALETLDLQGNFLASISQQVLRNLTSLKTLDLSYNSISSLSFLSVGLPLLTTALFAGNAIDSITNVFATCPAISYLSLNGNALKTLSAGDLSILPLLTQLYLGDNPWNCCGLEWLRNVNALQDPMNVVCARPALAKGASLFASSSPIVVCSMDIPSAPQAPSISAITPFSVQLSWPATSGNAYDVDWYLIEYIQSGTQNWTRYLCEGGVIPTRMDGGPMDLLPCMIQSLDYYGSPTNPLVLVVNRLDPYTQYSFRVTAHSPLNSNTFSAASANSSTVRTETYYPSKAPLPTLTPNTTTIAVDINPPLPPNGVITQYVVRLFSDAGVLQQSVVVNTTRAVFHSMTPYANYSVSVQAYTSLGAGAASDWANTTTLEDAPMVPSAPVLASATSLSINVRWSAIPRARANGIITGYIITLTFPNATSMDLAAGMSLQSTLPDLKPATQYSITLKAMTAAGTSPSSSPLVVFTLDSVPSQPDAPVVQAYNSTCFQLNWTEPSLPNGVITFYNIYLWLNSTTIQRTYNFTGSTRFAILCGFLPARNHSFSVAAYTSLGGSRPSVTTTGRTADAPANVAKISRSSASTRRINVSWSEPEEYVGNIVNYELYQVRKLRSLLYYSAVQDDATYLVYSGTSTTTSISNLDPATLYSYFVLAYTSVGCRNDSLSSIVLTATDLPTRPGQPQVTLIDSFTVVLQWTAPISPNGNITKYGIFTQYSSTPLMITSGGSQQATLTELSDETTYTFTIAAYTSAGIGEYSRPSQITTPTQDKSYSQTIVIVVVLAFVVVLSIGFAYERRRTLISRQAAITNEAHAVSDTSNNSDKSLLPRTSNQFTTTATSNSDSTNAAQAVSTTTMSPLPAPPNTIAESSPSSSPVLVPLSPVSGSNSYSLPQLVHPLPGTSIATRRAQLKLDSSSSEDDEASQYV